MTETVPKGSGQLDPETAAKLRLQIQQARQATEWGRIADGDRLKDYALEQVTAALNDMGRLLGDSDAS
jgi:hypothetical protein